MNIIHILSFLGRLHCYNFTVLDSQQTRNFVPKNVAGASVKRADVSDESNSPDVGEGLKVFWQTMFLCTKQRGTTWTLKISATIMFIMYSYFLNLLGQWSLRNHKRKKEIDWHQIQLALLKCHLKVVASKSPFGKIVLCLHYFCHVHVRVMYDNSDLVSVVSVLCCILWHN